MDTEKLINIITSQIPLLILTINNGVTFHNLFPVILIPLVILIGHYAPRIMKFFKAGQVPKDYVYYYVSDGSESQGINYGIDFIDSLSVFLNAFHPNSIRQGNVKSYHKYPVDPNSSFRCFGAIISPDDSYFCKFSFADRVGSVDILEKIKESGFAIPARINLKKLCEHPIYLVYENITEQVVTNNRKEKNVMSIKKNYIKISTIDIETAQDFIYIVINYCIYKTNNINDFRLTKFMYYQDSKDGFDVIESMVNLKKSYQNVFLTKKNEDIVINSISSWNQNKIQHLEQGIPNKLAFFFVGAAGSGKSSTVYAIASETKKHIVSVNLQDFTNLNFLALMSDIDNKVVVFDDIDAYKFLHKRTTDTIMPDSDEKIKQLELALISKDKGDFFKSKFEKEMTLDVFLEVLDGYNYLNNCIVILTSNHPELLDPAITRPGRVDYTIQFDLCDQYQFRNIFKYYVGVDYQGIDDQFVFSENKMTTSYLINTIVLPNRKDPKKIIACLTNKEN